MNETCAFPKAAVLSLGDVLPPTPRIPGVDCVRTDEGIGLTEAARTAIRRAVRRIGLILEKAGIPVGRLTQSKIIPLYRLSILGRTV